MTGGDIIGEALAQAGARFAFGIPGGEVLALMDGLDRAGIRFVLAKHENAAGFMAEGAWHASGTLPILVATVGPGVANAVNVVANAEQDRVPLIFLTGCVDPALAESYTHQVFDHQAVLRPIVKASFRAERGALAPMLAKAVAIATEGQPGPVHIDVPTSVAEDETDEPTARLAPRPVPARPAPGPALDAARAALAGAERPLVIAGLDALEAGAGPAISALCAARGIPLITTYKGKGLMDETAPLCLGGAGLSPKADAILRPLIRRSDCILLAGYDPIEMRVGWRDIWAPGQTVVEVTPVARHHGMHSVSHTLLADVGAGLAALTDTLPDTLTDGPTPWPEGEPSAARRALADAFPGAGEGFGPATVFATLRAAMPPETVVTVDSGAHRILVSQMWPCPGPRQMLQSTALCTMGCALPLAAGHALAQPGTPVLAFVGDAGLEMGLGELATLRDRALPVILCVLVDESLALIELKQRGSQRANLGVDFGATDFPAVAAAMGGFGAWIDDRESLMEEAAAALHRTDRFTLLACRIGRRPYDGLF